MARSTRLREDYGSNWRSSKDRCRHWPARPTPSLVLRCAWCALVMPSSRRVGAKLCRMCRWLRTLGRCPCQIVACQAQVPAQPVQQGASGAAKGRPQLGCTWLKASASEPPLVRQTLQTDTLFAFDKADVADLLPGGVQRLQALAERLKGAQSIDTIRVTGHRPPGHRCL